MDASFLEYHARFRESGHGRGLSPVQASGKLRPLAVTSPQRFPQLPNVPTLAEQGVAGIDAEAWWGLLAPAKTPAPIIARMNAGLLSSPKRCECRA